MKPFIPFTLLGLLFRASQTGHTFEKKAIEEWLKRHLTCPLTKHKLGNSDLRPNWAVKTAIDEWKGKSTPGEWRAPP